ncbi:MAG: hypothetical protein K2N51_02550 [Lachnospiraceae bacterium]|nr:hypothetical protein [Lachnospiraceae bacterium]
MNNKKIGKWFLLVIIPVLMELFVFNYQFWITHIGVYPKESMYTSTDIKFSEGFLVDGENVVIQDVSNCTLTLGNIDKTVHSVYFDIIKRDLEEKNENTKVISCHLSIKDDGNMASYYSIPDNGAAYKIVPTEKNSKWVRIHPYGKLQGLQISLDQESIQTGETIQINSITLNGKHPMNFSLIRFLALLFGIVFFALFRGSSKYYKICFTDMSKNKRTLMVCVMVAVQILIFWWMGQITYDFSKDYDVGAGNEYHFLTESLAEGHTWLKQEPPKYLQEMDNPYDNTMRYQYYEETGEWYQWDAAYYEGKYYVYFGIIPALLFYLPYYLLTGNMLSNTIVVFFAAAISMIFLARLLKVTVERYFPKTSVLTFGLLLWVSMTTFGFINLFRSVQVYEVAIAVGLMFAIAGLDLWVESVQDDKVLSKVKLFFGSLCIALVAGCRPGIVLIAFTSFVIFRKFLIQNKKICLHQHRKTLFIFAIPFVVVAAGLMYYNYIRFGSPFDFGVNYNLTTNDVTKRGFSFGRLPIGIFEYLFSPLSVNGIFPYLQLKNVVSAYMGKSIVEEMAGGLFWIYPFLMIGFLPLIRKKIRKQYPMVSIFSFVIMAIGGVLVVVDTNSGGILSRYQADFAMFFIIAAVLSVLMQEGMWFSKKEMTENFYDENVVLWRNAILVLILISVILGYLFFLLLYRGMDMGTYKPEFYYKIKYLLEFWR